ncbi:MAG: hypothetical protein MK132_10340 [Lentisphaerales bacterium]|nr:hypothetical protein [Lentisphaerales bacterium]
MKSLILTILLILPATGLASTNNDPLTSMPLSKMFWELYQERNIIGQNDCSNKCGRYLRALVKQGHTAEIVVIKPHTSSMLHAIVKLTEGDKVTYLDPTRGTLAYDLDMLGSFKESIQHTQLATLGAQYK